MDEVSGRGCFSRLSFWAGFAAGVFCDCSRLPGQSFEDRLTCGAVLIVIIHL